MFMGSLNRSLAIRTFHCPVKDKESPDRLCDPELFDTLRKIVLPRSIQEKNVDMIREAELIPNAC